MEPKLYYWYVYNNVKADILKYLLLFYNEYINTCIPPSADPEIVPYFCNTPLGIFVCFVLPLLVCFVLPLLVCFVLPLLVFGAPKAPLYCFQK